MAPRWQARAHNGLRRAGEALQGVLSMRRTLSSRPSDLRTKVRGEREPGPNSPRRWRNGSRIAPSARPGRRSEANLRSPPRRLVDDVDQARDILRRHWRRDVFVLQRVPESHVETLDLADLERLPWIELIHRLLGDIAR